MRLFGLRGASAPGCSEGEARRLLLRRAVDYLQSCQQTDEPGLRHAYDDLLHQYGHRLESIEDCGPGIPATDRHARTMANVVLETVRIEREELIRLRDVGTVNDEVYRALEHELDLSETWSANAAG